MLTWWLPGCTPMAKHDFLFQVAESKFRYDSGNITPVGKNLPK